MSSSSMSLRLLLAGFYFSLSWCLRGALATPEDVPRVGDVKFDGAKVTECPLSDPIWAHTSGVPGAILGVKGSDNSKPNFTTSEMFWYGSVPDPISCWSKCQSFSSSINAKEAYNGAVNGCAYWVYNSANEDKHAADCFLLDCTACTTSNSFAPDTRAKGHHYVSGAGPALCGTKGAPLTKVPQSSDGAGGHLGFTPGAVTGNPHFSGGDGSHFDFTGTPNHNYCLVSDSHLHINAYFGGRYEEFQGQTKVLNWVREIGVLWGHHTIRLGAREGASWQYGNGYLGKLEVDGEKVVLAHPGEVASLADGKVEVEWVAAWARSWDFEVDVYAIRIPGVLEMELRLRPEVSTLRTPEDGHVHIDISFPTLRVSSTVHGVLGQTYRPDHLDRLSRQKLQHSNLLGVMLVPADNAEGFLDSSPDAYLATDVLKPDCLVARFAHFEKMEAETAFAIQTSFGKAISTASPTRKALRGVMRN